jgi:hypothetical protein
LASAENRGSVVENRGSEAESRADIKIGRVSGADEVDEGVEGVKGVEGWLDDWGVQNVEGGVSWRVC